MADRPEGPFADALGKPLVGAFHHGAQPIDPFVFRDDDGQPTRPFTRVGKVLQQDPDVATSAGHHLVIPVPRSDTWYIIHHRRPLGTTNGHHRELCIDQMRFNPDGTIQPVRITFEGVEARRLAAAR